MRNIAFEFSCPVFTACQLNRGAMSEKGGGSKATISTSQISESKGIVDTCDYICWYCTDRRSEIQKR